MAGAAGALSPTGGSRGGAGGPSSAGTGGTAGASGAGGSPAHAGAWRIMPLGDSITGNTCYPQLLSQYTSDGVHPNPAGSQLVAGAWYAALVAKNIP